MHNCIFLFFNSRRDMAVSPIIEAHWVKCTWAFCCVFTLLQPIAAQVTMYRLIIDKYFNPLSLPTIIALVVKRYWQLFWGQVKLFLVTTAEWLVSEDIQGVDSEDFVQAVDLTAFTMIWFNLEAQAFGTGWIFTTRCLHLNLLNVVVLKVHIMVVKVWSGINELE